MLSTMRTGLRLRPAAASALARRARVPDALSASGAQRHARLRHPQCSCGLSTRATPGGLVVALRVPARARADVAALLRRWGSSKAAGGGGDQAAAAKPKVMPKLDGWLGMTALEAAEAAADPWTAFRMRVAVIVQFGCFLYILNNYGLSSTLCQGPSMMPTLNPAGDVVLVEHVTVTLGRLERGDVIVAKSPTDPNAVVCKRILGLPGDTIPKDPRYPYFRGADEDIVVPAGKVWLQGDNIRNSTDSRNYGAVPLPLITGRVFFKVWPLTEAGLIENQMPPPTTTKWA